MKERRFFDGHEEKEPSLPHGSGFKREDGDRREGLSAAAAEFHTGEEERREEEKRSSKVAALTRGHGRSMVQCSMCHEGTTDASRLERGKVKR